jgi:ATP/maltotriose-dependent transcriptional regulator MalT
LSLVFAGCIGDAIVCLAPEGEIDDPCLEPPKLLSLGTDSRVAVLVWYATALGLHGLFDRAKHRCGQALERARRLEHPHSLAAALWHASFAGLEQGRCEEAEPHITEMMRLSEEASLSFFRSLALGFLGRLLVERGDALAGIRAIGQARSLHASLGFELDEAYMVRDLADAYRRVGRIEEGVALADEGIAAAVRTGAGFMLAEHHRVRGELLACRPGTTGDVERELLTARRIAREQEAHLYELRAAIGLARLRWDEGRHESARAVLEQSYGAFGEGHDQVSELRRARGLVELWRRS